MNELQHSGPPKKSAWLKVVVLLLVIGAAVFGYANYGDSLTLEEIAEKEADLRNFQAKNPILVYGLAFVIYVAVTGLSLPGAVPLTLVFGWFFGLWRGVLVVSFASTMGATLAFLLSRYVLGNTIQAKFGNRLRSFNEALKRDGALFLFTMRLIPAIPFFVINLVMGLTPIPVLTYWIVSQIGMLPGTIVFVYAGSAVPDPRTLSAQGIGGILTPKVITAFVILGLFPLVVKFIMKRVRPKASTGVDTPDEGGSEP